MLEYLKLEKSMRDFYDKNMDCSACGPKDCCCNYSSGRNSGMIKHIVPWDHYIANYNFPKGRSISEAKSEGEHCPYLSEKGCAIPVGRPNICTTFICEKNDTILSGRELTDIVDSYCQIGDLMSELMMEDHNQYREKNYELKIDSFFRAARDTIKNSDKFQTKFEYKPIISKEAEA
jgi:hypothetical protein